MLRSLFYSIVNAIIPPRVREIRLAALTLEDLESLRITPPAGGGLPYHDKRVTALIGELKYNANARAYQLAGVFLSEELLGIASEELGKPLLIPIPMHPKRRRERGYNQTELLCKAALVHLNTAYIYEPEVLMRVSHTPPQQTLTRRKRLSNVKNSMRVVETEKVRGRVCVVIDDVSTTGATLAEAARALYKAGARKVHTVALARS